MQIGRCKCFLRSSFFTNWSNLQIGSCVPPFYLFNGSCVLPQPICRLVPAVFVFITAESEYAMVNRLVDRKTETKESLLVRIATAREEVKHARNFDYVVVNIEGKLEEAVGLMESIIDAEKAKVIRKNAVI